MQVPEGWNPIFEVSAQYKEQIFSMSPDQFSDFLSSSRVSGIFMALAEIVCDMCWHVMTVEDLGKTADWLSEVWLAGLTSYAFPYPSIPYMVRTAVNIIKESDDDIKLEVMAGLVRTIHAYFPGEVQVREES